MKSWVIKPVYRTGFDRNMIESKSLILQVDLIRTTHRGFHTARTDRPRPLQARRNR